MVPCAQDLVLSDCLPRFEEKLDGASNAYLLESPLENLIIKSPPCEVLQVSEDPSVERLEFVSQPGLDEHKFDLKFLR
jgi:hypothetical protein